MAFFGDRSRFAVEYELDRNPDSSWLFGKFCYWVEGQQVGDYDLGTSLSDVIGSLATIVRDRGKRENGRLFRLPGSDAFAALDAALYGQIPSLFDEIALSEQWAHHNLTLSVDIFDGWKVFLIENSDNARVLYGRRSEFNDLYSPWEVGLKAGECDDALLQAFVSLNELLVAIDAR